MKENLIVITGGNSGLGLELVKLFCAKSKVLVLARTKRGELKGVFYEYGNIADEQFVKDTYAKYSKEFNISYLINNAAVGVFGAPEENDCKKITKVLEGNLVGLILNTTYALPLIKEQGGKIVNILSTAALKGNVNESIYCAAKWGARGFSESLKATFKGTNIKVISVYPGGMNTDFWNENRSYVPTEKSDKWMNPQNVAKTIYDNVTNENLCVSDITIERP